MKKLNSTILTIMSACLASTVNAAKMCLGTPVVLAASIGITCGLLLTSISVTCAASSVNVGGTISCSANVQPNNASDKGVTWSSNPPGVATVDSSGVVTGVTAGNVTITATAVDGSGVTGTTSITVAAVDYCTYTVSSATLSINSIFSSICSPLSATTKFPYNNCGGYTPSFTGNPLGNNWTGTSCPLVSTTATIYGNSRCSNQRDTAGHGYGDNTADGNCFRTVNYEPTDNYGSGVNCWCQLCTDNTKATCGGWVFRYVVVSAADCTWDCAGFCGLSSNTRAFRAALCAAVAP